MLVAALLVAAAHGQQAGQREVSIRSGPYQLPPLIIRVESSAVPVSVVVRDTKGEPVGGLAAANFKFLDNGQPRPLASFAVDTHAAGSVVGRAPGPLAGPRPAPSPAGTRPAAPARRYLAIFFDDVSTSGSDLAHARAAAERFVRQALGSGDDAAVLTASGLEQAPFTGDPSVLLAAIGAIRAHPRASTHTSGCLRISDYQAYLIANHLDPSALDAAIGLKVQCDRANGLFQTQMEGAMGAAPGGNEDSAYVLATARGIWEQNQAASEDLLAAVNRAVSYAGAQPGARVLVLASGGFLAGTLQAQQDDIIAHALRADVTISALDARGLYVEDPDLPLSEETTVGVLPLGMFVFNVESQFSEGMEREAAMANLALSTGGLLFHNDNDLDLGFRQLGLTPSVSYEMSFAPPLSAQDGKLHRLKIVVSPNHDYTIETRRGYVAPLPMTAAAPGPVEATAAAMRGSDSQSGLSGSAQVAGGRVHFHLDLAGVRVQRTGGRERDELLFTVGTFDAAGRFLAGKQAAMTLALTDPTWEKLSREGLNADLALPAGAGAARVRCVVAETNGGKVFAASIALPRPATSPAGDSAPAPPAVGPPVPAPVPARPAPMPAPPRRAVTEHVTAATARLIARGDAALAEGDPDAAVAAYRRADRGAEGDCTACLLRLAAAERSQGQLDAATRAAQQAVAAAAGDARVLAAAHEAVGDLLSARAGFARHDSGRLRQAQAEYRAALAAAPADPEVLQFKLGIILLRRGLDAQAQRQLRAVLAAAHTAAPLAAETREVLASPALALEPIAPVFAFTAGSGEIFSNATRQGKVTLLTFWNSQSDRARKAIPMLLALQEQFGQRFDFAQASVDTGESEVSWKIYLAAHHLDWPQYFDRDRALTIAFGIAQVPYFVLVGPDGAILTAEGLSLNGDTDPSGLTQWHLEMAIRRALGSGH